MKKYIGDRKLYNNLLKIAVPIMIQNGRTNFVKMLDNLMVGQVGTEQMSGVAIVNQLMFIYFLCIFGGVSGVGIFTAQYCGNKDDEGIRYTFRYKLIMGAILTALCVTVFLIWGKDLVQLYLNGESDGGDPKATLSYALGYMHIELFSLPAILISIVISSTLRECKETITPMRAGIVAVFVNLILNYLLIYGKAGLPQLGVNGAAIATVIARFVEMSIMIVWVLRHKDKHTYFNNVLKSFYIPRYLVKRFFVKGLPLLVNESIWSIGIAMLSQAYSIRGLNVIAATNIANTINNVFNIVFIAMGDAVAIIIGQLLGAGKMEEAKDQDNKIIAFSIFNSIVIGSIMFVTSGLYPKLYNTNAQAQALAASFIMVQAVIMPKDAFLHTAYFTLRSGGKTIITFLFDSVFMMVVSVPIAYVLSRYTSLDVIWIFFIVHMADLIKCLIGLILLKKGVWINNIISEET
jgi:putative MATE family efflux protein